MTHKKICTYDNCTFPVYARKLCAYHYKISLSKNTLSRPLKKSNGPLVSLLKESREKTLKHGKKRKIRIDFKAPLEVLETYSISDLKKVADYRLRHYLLANAVRNLKRQIKCPIKNKWYSEEDIEVAHYIPRSCLTLRYDLDNVILCSKQSNTWDHQIWLDEYKCSKHIYDYGVLLGEDRVEDLKRRAKEKKRFSKSDYLEVIKKFT